MGGFFVKLCYRKVKRRMVYWWFKDNSILVQQPLHHKKMIKTQCALFNFIFLKNKNKVSGSSAKLPPNCISIVFSLLIITWKKIRNNNSQHIKDNRFWNRFVPKCFVHRRKLEVVVGCDAVLIQGPPSLAQPLVLTCVFEVQSQGTLPRNLSWVLEFKFVSTTFTHELKRKWIKIAASLVFRGPSMVRSGQRNMVLEECLN